MGNPSTPDEFRRELLLSDLRSWNESFWKNEGAGESRIRFYIALVTAVGGGLSALYQSARTGDADSYSTQALFQELVPVALAGLLLLGLVTFARMVRRNQVTDEYKEWGNEIRRYLLEDRLFERIYGLERKEPEGRDLLNGGLAPMMLVMNGVVAGVLAGFFTLSAGDAVAWITGVAGFLLACWGQSVFLRSRHDRAVAKHRARRALRESHPR